VLPPEVPPPELVPPLVDPPEVLPLAVSPPLVEPPEVLPLALPPLDVPPLSELHPIETQPRRQPRRMILNTNTEERRNAFTTWFTSVQLIGYLLKKRLQMKKGLCKDRSDKQKN
jgi:hypothetical protein